MRWTRLPGGLFHLWTGEAPNPSGSGVRFRKAGDGMVDVAPKDGVQIDARGNRFRAVKGQDLMPGCRFEDPTKENKAARAAVRERIVAARNAATKPGRGASETGLGKGADQTG